MSDTFWGFSLAFYNDGDVQRACLELQVDASTQEDFRNRVETVELQSAKIEQQHPEAAALADSRDVVPVTAAFGNLAAYAEFLRTDLRNTALGVRLRRWNEMVAG